MAKSRSFATRIRMITTLVTSSIGYGKLTPEIVTLEGNNADSAVMLPR